MPELVNDPDLPEPVFPGSHVVIDDDYAFFSGLVAADLPGGDAVVGDVAAETERVMTALRGMLEKVGCTPGCVVRVDVHLADLGDIGAMDAVYRRFFDGGRYPARTCTESPRLFGGCRVEVTMMARRR